MQTCRERKRGKQRESGWGGEGERKKEREKGKIEGREIGIERETVRDALKRKRERNNRRT